MASKIQICNLALSRIGANTITSLDDGTLEANTCKIFFDDLAEEVMIEGSWTSTIKRRSLAKTTRTPEFGFSSEHQLPTDPRCLKVLDLDEDTPGDTRYTIEGDKLLSDNNTVKIRYIAKIEDTEDWDPLLKRAFIARLTAEIVYPITGDARKAEAELRRYNLFLTEGLAINGQQGSQKSLVLNDLTEVR